MVDAGPFTTAPAFRTDLRRLRRPRPLVVCEDQHGPMFVMEERVRVGRLFEPARARFRTVFRAPRNRPLRRFCARLLVLRCVSPLRVH